MAWRQCLWILGLSPSRWTRFRGVGSKLRVPRWKKTRAMPARIRILNWRSDLFKLQFHFQLTKNFPCLTSLIKRGCPPSVLKHKGQGGSSQLVSILKIEKRKQENAKQICMQRIWKLEGQSNRRQANHSTLIKQAINVTKSSLRLHMTHNFTARKSNQGTKRTDRLLLQNLKERVAIF